MQKLGLSRTSSQLLARRETRSKFYNVSCVDEFSASSSRAVWEIVSVENLDASTDTLERAMGKKKILPPYKYKKISLEISV